MKSAKIRNIMHSKKSQQLQYIQLFANADATADAHSDARDSATALPELHSSEMQMNFPFHIMFFNNQFPNGLGYDDDSSGKIFISP